MSNFSSILKAEIARVARKSIKAELEGLRRTVASQRTEVVSLKRRLEETERALKQLQKLKGRAPEAAPAQEPATTGQLRFRAAGLASNRRRLGLSAAEFGLLVGATGQSVYAWEQGKTVPRGKALAAIAALRGIGKKEVRKRLEALAQP